MGKILFDISDNGTTVRALKEGNEAAFEAVYKRYCRPLRAYAGRILGDGEEAREVVQEVMVAVWERRERLDEGRELRHYLLRAVHNNALKRREREEGRRRREAEAERERWEEAERAGEEEAREEREAEVGRAVEGLAEGMRRVVRMSFWEGKRNGEIAEEMGVSVRTVETVLYKAKRRLEKILKKR